MLASCIAAEQKFEPTSTTLPRLYLKKTRFKYGPIFVINLPQVAGDCKPFDWNYIDGFFD